MKDEIEKQENLTKKVNGHNVPYHWKQACLFSMCMQLLCFNLIFKEIFMKDMWVMHIIGTDDVHEMPDEVTALREANKLNKRVVDWRSNDPSPHDPFIVALAKNTAVEEA